ncbi:unnamed protein product [Phaeothamnion confervicola]
MASHRRGSSSSDGKIMTGTTAWAQKTISLGSHPRGCHLITSDIVREFPELRKFRVGVANIMILHTSASITINENADPDVREDLESALNQIVPVKWHHEMFKHTDEGPEDMTGHVKSSLMGASVNVPITDGRLALGTWQGVYLCEHRGGGHTRRITVTVQGLAEP